MSSEDSAAIVFGALWARGRDGAQRQAGELAELKKQLEEANREVLLQRAMGKAAADMAAEIVREIEQADAGTPGAKRLSEPGARNLRNEEFAQRTDTHLQRLSSGRHQLGMPEREKLKNRKVMR